LTGIADRVAACTQLSQTHLLDTPMKVTQEKLPASQIGLEIEVTPEMSQKTYEKVVTDLVRTANIPGFRKGKVPRQVIVQRYGSGRINGEVVQELIDVAFKAALKQENIEALGNFQLRSDFGTLLTAFAPGQVLTFKASVDVQPEVSLKSYQGFTIQAEEIKPDPKRLATTLEGYQKQHATLVPVEDRAAQAGDTVIVDYYGRYQTASGAEEDVPGGKAEGFQVEIEDGKFIPGFVEGIVGISIGETKEISVTFPEDYPAPELAAAAAKFSITLHEIKSKELPELDDDFASDVTDGEYATLAELTAMLESRFQEEADEQTKTNKQEAILNQLLTQVEVDLPNSLVEREVEYMITQTAMQLQQQGMDIRQLFTPETVPMLKERSRPDAIDRLKRTMALGEVAKQAALAVPDAELALKVTETLEELEGQDVDPERLRAMLQEEMLKEKILAHIEANSTVELVPEGSLKPAETEAVLEAAPPGDAITVEATPVEAAALEAGSTDESAAPKAEKKTAKKKAEPKAEAAEPEVPAAKAKAKAKPEAQPDAETEASAEAKPKKAAKKKSS
jgi:trigger factor